MDGPSASPIDVSVLLTVYGRTEYLSEALTGVLAQTFLPFEILVLDDSDSPEICAIVAGFSDPRIRYRPNRTNLGVAVSLREALPGCRGKYVAILNDDDAWEPTFLERLVHVLDEGQETTLAFCDFWVMAASGAIDEVASKAYSQTWGRTDLPPGEVADFPDFALVKMGVPLAMGALWRKDALNPQDLVPEVSGAYDFWVACLLAAGGGKAAFVKERLTRYRVHSGMESDRRAADKNENLVYVYRELLRRDLFPSHRLLLRQRLAIAQRLVASDLWNFGHPLAALGKTVKAASLFPPIAAGRFRRLLRRTGWKRA